MSGEATKGGESSLLLSWTTALVTPNAVSVVICTGPRWRPGKPSTRNSEVRSRGGSSPGVLSRTCANQPCSQDSRPHLECPVCARHFQKFSAAMVHRNPTPKRNHSNRPSPSSGASSFSAFGSSKHTLSREMPFSSISCITDFWCANASAREWSASCEKSEERVVHDAGERWVKWTVAPGPANDRMCYSITKSCQHSVRTVFIANMRRPCTPARPI